MLNFFISPLTLNSLAPEFGRLDQHSRTIYSKQLIKQGGFLIHFYFAPWSRSSKQSLLALKALTPLLQDKNIAVVASNPYDWQIQHELANELELPFSLLYDPIAKTANVYKACFVKTFFNHEVTYLVSNTGHIVYCNKGIANYDKLFSDISSFI